MKYYLSYDIGGTNIRAALFDPRFKLIRQVSGATAKNHAAILSQVKEMFDGILADARVNKKDVDVVGISIAAGIKNGKAIRMPNLKLKLNTEVKKTFAGLLGLRCEVINDMKAAAYGELKFGAGRGVEDFICLTFSTGVGGGVVMDGKLQFGADGQAGEVGAMVIDLHDPAGLSGRMHGNFENLASGTGLANDYKKRTGLKLSAHEIQIRAEKGDKQALASFAESAKAIGYGIASICNLLNPSLVILSGSHIKKGKALLMPKIKKILSDTTLVMPKIVFSTHADMALLGAAKYAVDSYGL